MVVIRGSLTHPFIKCFTLPQEHDISLDEIRIECLHDAQNNIPRRGKERGQRIVRRTGVGVSSERQVLTYKITPAHTTGLDFSKSIFQPYSPVPKAMKTDDQPSASLTSVWT